MLKFEQLLGGVLTRNFAARSSHSKGRALIFNNENVFGGAEAAAGGGISRVSSLIERNRTASNSQTRQWAALGRNARVNS